MAITSYKAVVGYYNGAGTPNITTAVTGQLSDGWIPIGSPILTDAYGQCTQMMAKTDTVPVIVTSAYTVVTAANPQPPDATWDAQGEPLWIDTATYLQAYTKGGSYLQTTVNLASGQVTGILPVAKGGTGAATTLAAAANLQVFSISNNLSEIVNRTAAWLNVRPTGPLPLAGDPVGDYDAATKRWVQNLINTGTVGPTMNGVMNYGVGKPLQHATRAYIPPYELPLDGQVVNRSDWPELWAWAQMTTPISDADWLASPSKRGSYSTGDGTTTFRLPDWNGVQPDSIPAVFFRGGVSAADMTIQQNAAPNITGHTGLVLMSKASESAGSLADRWYNFWSTAQSGGTSSNTYQENSIRMDASWSSDSYGRNSTTEVYPNHVSGVWVVRASGGFVAANTQWSVLNGDATLPPTSTVVRGGEVKSGYTVGGALRKEVSLTSYETIGGSTSQSGAEIITGSASYKFTDAGIAQATSWNSTSDPRVKSLIEVIPDPLDLMRGIRGYSWYYEHTASKGFGFLSSEVGVNFSGAVNTFGDAELPDGTIIHDVEGVDTVGVSAALHHEAILALMDKIAVLEAKVEALTNGEPDV